MLKIEKKAEGGETVISLEGELDTLSSQTLEEQLDSLIADADKVTVDLEKLDYITSAGLRILLQMENIMEEKGSMRIVHVREDIMEIFEVTGFTEVLHIE